ncbi:NFACT RNA binding domain-containing protein [Candidatus Palauibacter sp.]|uniref:NFACT RNA binding domain-containing protein n=1 Tax=Candidatus Palauibacter sp. TaxID=3101350 RepID=UPI003AF203B7
MSVRYDSLLARTLAREILDRWQGCRIAGLRMASGRRALELAFEDGSRLVAMLHPLHGYLLERAPHAPAAGVGGKALRVGRLSLLDARAPADERALLLTFGDRTGCPWELLAIELQTRRRNAVHCRRIEDGEGGTDGAGAPDGDSSPWRIETALLSRDAGDRPLRRGACYVPPASARRGVAAPPSEADWAAVLTGDDAGQAPDDAGRRRAVLQTWAWTSALNVDWILAGEDPAETYARYRDLHALAAAPPEGRRPAYLLERRAGPQPYPLALGPGRKAQAGLLDAATQLVAAAGGPASLLDALPAKTDDDADGDEAAQLGKRLKARRKRHQRRAAALERQLAAAGPPDEPRLLGQILLARKDEVRKGASTVTLAGFDGADHEIALDPARDVVANAEGYFDEARRRERALERLPSEIAAAAERAAEYDAHLEQFAESGPSEALWAVAGGKPSRPGARGGASRQPEPRLPYIRLRTSGGLELRVGRGPHDNDDLTFRHSAPDDIWLHASQASGAHVILRWGRKDENPPRRDLLEAAVAAAVHSGARHSGTAPVVWTRRKYVRKPRKSPPGTVTPTRVQTIFAKPDGNLVKTLRQDDR